jgi:hypothetical protein
MQSVLFISVSVKLEHFRIFKAKPNIRSDSRLLIDWVRSLAAILVLAQQC